MITTMQMSRRTFLALSATVVAGCTTSEGAGTATAPSPTTGQASTSPVASTVPAIPTTTSATTTSTTEVPPTTEPIADVTLDTDPFTLGVASGDPDGSSVVLWTRLSGELPATGVPVTWFVVADDGAQQTTGTFTTGEALGGSVHVVVAIDGPVTYGFTAGGWESPTGRTAPLAMASPDGLRVATASCQDFEDGFYAAHRDIAEWAPDLVLFLGDFIYEGASNPVADGRVRAHEGPEPVDVAGYRGRYATYLADPQLQGARAASPWICIWDDHEVENNYAGVTSQDDADPVAFAARRTMAYQVWWENTPTRLAPPTAGEPYAIYRGVDIAAADGRALVQISVLDGRQFRSDQVCNTTFDPGPPCPGWDDPALTMLGAEQEAWIADRFATSTARWNCVAQQTVMTDLRFPGTGGILNYDQWDGYVPARDRLLSNAPSDLIVLTGDIHLAGVGLVGPLGRPAGVEFVTTSISSSANVPLDFAPVVESFENIVAAELTSRGYTRHTITADTWTAEYRTVDDSASPDSAVSTWRTVRVDRGTSAVTPIE